MSSNKFIRLTQSQLLKAMKNPEKEAEPVINRTSSNYFAPSAYTTRVIPPMPIEKAMVLWENDYSESM